MTPAIADVPVDRASTRFQQIAAYERRLRQLEALILDLKEQTKAFREEADVMLGKLRAAARDEGDLPLFPEAGL